MPDDIIAGDYVTPACQGKVNRKSCRWPKTVLAHGLWLCEICERDWWLRQAVRQARAAACKSIARARAKAKQA